MTNDPRPTPRTIPTQPDPEIVRCTLCDSALEFRYPDGTRHVFTAHSADYCKIATEYRIRMLETMVQRSILDANLARDGEISKAREANDARIALEAIAGIAARCSPDDFDVATLEEVLRPFVTRRP